MAYYVYIIEKELTGIFYKGFSQDYLKREWEHNSNFSQYAKMKGKWNLVYVEELPTKRDALIHERKLKHANKDYLKWLIKQPSNILRK